MDIKVVYALSGMLAGSLVLAGCLGGFIADFAIGTKAFASQAPIIVNVAMLAVPSTKIPCPPMLSRNCPDLRRKARPCTERPVGRFQDECRNAGQGRLL
jgi:hypothetical protein